MSTPGSGRALWSALAKIGDRDRVKKAAIGAAIGLLVAVATFALGFWDVLGVESQVTPVAAFAVVGLWTGMTGRLAWISVICLALTTACFLVALTPLTNRAMRWWVREDSASVGQVGAVVVLSAGLNSDGNLDAASVDRLLTGLALVQDGIGSRLLTTRFVDTRHDEHATSDRDQRRLVKLAREDSAWTILGRVSSTREEADLAAAFLLPRGVRSIAVVTSPAHTRRACATFEMVGFRVYCVPARERGRSTWSPKDAGDRLASFRSYLYERLAVMKYKMNGWVRP